MQYAGGILRQPVQKLAASLWFCPMGQNQPSSPVVSTKTLESSDLSRVFLIFPHWFRPHACLPFLMIGMRSKNAFKNQIKWTVWPYWYVPPILDTQYWGYRYMKYSYEYKRMCVELYRQGKWPETPEGKQKRDFHKMIRKWVRDVLRIWEGIYLFWNIL